MKGLDDFLTPWQPTSQRFGSIWLAHFLNMTWMVVLLYVFTKVIKFAWTY